MSVSQPLKRFKMLSLWPRIGHTHEVALLIFLIQKIR